jgi:hypothetical protein
VADRLSGSEIETQPKSRHRASLADAASAHSRCVVDVQRRLCAIMDEPRLASRLGMLPNHLIICPATDRGVCGACGPNGGVGVTGTPSGTFCRSR